MVISAVMKASAFGRNRGPRPSVQIRRRCGSTTRIQPDFSGNAFPSGEHITMLNSPPGTRSIAALATRYGLGANHCFSSSGSVHARQSWAGLAFTVRSRRRSSSSFLFICIFLNSQCFDEGIQLIQPGFPNAAFVLNPALSRCQCVRTELARADTPNLTGNDDLARFKHADMFHEAGQGHAMALRKIANAGRAVGELRDHRAAGAIRQGMKDAIKVSHLAN